MREKESDFSYAPESVKEEWDSFTEEVSNASVKIQQKSFTHFTPKFVDTKSADVDTKRSQSIAEKRQKAYFESKLSQPEAKVNIETDMPVTVVPIGDVHYGSQYTNYKMFERHKKKIEETPGVYTVLMHNLVDNGMPGRYPANMAANAIPPHDQFATMQKHVKELDEKGKVLGAVMSDCHEGWSWNVAGVEPERLLFGYEGRNFPIVENGGILNVMVGLKKKFKYAIGLWHKQGPFNSRFNPEHSLRQNRRLYHEGKTDAEIGAHTHVTAASASYEGSVDNAKPVNWLKVGTYKGTADKGKKVRVTDRWAMEKFGTSGNRPGVALHLMADRKETDDSIDFDTGIEKHEAFRTKKLIDKMGLGEKFRKLMGE